MSEMTVLQRPQPWDDLPGPLRLAYRQQIDAHNDKAREHYLKYCEGDKCPRRRMGLKCDDWHGCDHGGCVDCAFNPYNMAKESIPA